MKAVRPGFRRQFIDQISGRTLSKMKPIKTWGTSMNFANILDHFSELQRSLGEYYQFSISVCSNVGRR